MDGDLNNEFVDSTATDTAVDTSTDIQTDTGSEPTRFKLEDGEFTVDDAKQWREDHLNKSKWQAELTRKSQEVADYKRLGDWLGSSQVPVEEKWKWFEQNFPKQAAKVESQATSQNDYISRIEQKLAMMEQKLQQNEQSVKVREVQEQLANAKTLHKDKWNEDHEDMIRNIWVAKGGSLIDVANKYFERLEKLFSAQQKSWLEGKNKDANNPAFTPKGGNVPAAKSKTLTSEEKKKAMEQELFGNNDD